MNWVWKWLCGCPDSGKIAQLQQDNANLTEAIKSQNDACAKIKNELEITTAKLDTRNFMFDSAYIKTIPSRELDMVLSERFLDADIKLADVTYQVTSLVEIQRWASFDPTNELSWRAEVMDCDKFALTDCADIKKENNYQLGNLAFGEAWGQTEIGYHAWNICYADGEIYFLEPQSDYIFKYSDTSIHNYKPDFIKI